MAESQSHFTLSGHALNSDSSALLPFATDSPSIGGVLKSALEDFFVEEIPIYLPCGEGEHLFLWIEKRDLGTPELVKHIARTLGVPQSEIGFAGRKDRQAVTRQFVSVMARSCPDPAVLENECLRVLEAKQHRNKLKTGHLRGNRFRIVVRDVQPAALEVAQRIIEQLAERGVPNYFGEQRFGITNETDLEGFRLLKGEPARRLGPDALRFALSAVQSRLFNSWLAERLTDGMLYQLLLGDIMQVVASGGCFPVEDVATEQTRYAARETVLTGPMFGPKMIAPTGEAAAREARVLERFDLPLSAFERYVKLTAGTRRPALLSPEGLRVEPVAEGLAFEFTLPAGAYATVVLREFLRN